jgi:hypothetical protein
MQFNERTVAPNIFKSFAGLKGKKSTDYTNEKHEIFTKRQTFSI